MHLSPAIVTLVLSSSLLAALLASLVNYLLASKEYTRDYYREVARRRLHAYEEVSLVIGMLRGAAYDENGQSSHIVFSQGLDGVVQINQAIASTIVNGIWLDPATRDLLVELNRLLLHVPHSDDRHEVFTAGVQIYEEVGKLRERLEKSTARSLLKLHDIRRFLREKERAARGGGMLRLEMMPKLRDTELSSRDDG